MGSLQNKTLSGMFWTLIQQTGARGVSFVVMILLARLLTPKDFGLIGMLMIFIQISQTLIDGGFNLALIQKKDIDEEDYSSVFYINLIVSFSLYLILYASAPFIAEFYRQPQLTMLARVFGVVFIINSFSYVQEARLTKEMRFKTIMVIHIPSTIIGGVVSIITAYMGFGVWSLVLMQVVTRLAYVIQVWIYAKWKPLLMFNREKAKSLFSFGGRLLLSRLLTTVYNNIFLIIIGRFYPIASVGHYQNAYNLSNTPSSAATSVLSNVTFPIFASIQDDDKRLKEGYKKIMQQACFWVCPAYVFAAVLADPIFRVLFNEKWIAAIPYFQWLCVVAIFQPLNTYNLNILNIKGRSDVFLKLQTVRRVVTIAAVLAAIPFGINALLVVQAGSSILTFLLFSHYSGRYIQYSLIEQVKDVMPIVLLSAGVGAVVMLVDHSIAHWPNILRATGGFALGCLLFGMIARYIKLSSYSEVALIFRNKVMKKLRPAR